MSDISRERLLDKRQALKLRLERRRVSGQARACGRLLCDAGVKFVKLVPHACRAALGGLSGLPGRDERFDWQAIPGGICERWENDAGRDRLFSEILGKCAAFDDRVAVIWHPFEAGLRLKAHDLAAHLPAFLDGVHDVVWIVAAKDSPWLIEIEPREYEICRFNPQSGE